MAFTAGFPGCTSNRSSVVSPPLIDLLPVSGKQLRARVEPRLAELVGTVVASLQVAGVSPVQVTDPRGRHW